MTKDKHGGNIYAAARLSGHPVRRVIDFSASINPLGPSARALRAIVSALPLTVHYPDPECADLREALAAHYHAAPEHLLVGNGSTELIHLLPRALSIKQALIVGPTFSEYARAVRLAGGRVMSINASPSERYRPPVERAVDAVRKSGSAVDAVFVCNPNNPTGQALDAASVVELYREISRRRGWMVVDETFTDYCEERSILPRLSRLSRLVALRSFTKFYALPGLRIGCLAGAPDIVRRIKRWQPAWSVNTLAQVAVLASIGDARYAARSRTFMDGERERLAEQLNVLPGVTAYPSRANFLLVELPARRRATPTARALARRGLLVRDCSSIDGLTPRMIRVAVRGASDNRRLVSALRRALK